MNKELIEAAECVIETAFGNTDGLTEAMQLQAIRMAVEDLKRELPDNRFEESMSASSADATSD